ncbi:MAG: hypothetical protein QMD85_03990, partial [Candidatus Aenigmarchaeota archaeon]|nr:hypothetical protein [Candidatus Aenigmarchaeota archaeon]MDI6722723.1 hypothetical protein [Candidatus Aenigmarchaeota archaeon]
SIEGKVGSPVTIPVTFSNTGSCGGSATITAVVPAGWNATSASTGYVTVGKSKDVDIAIKIPASATTSTVTFNAIVAGKALSSKTVINILPAAAPKLPETKTPEIKLPENVTGGTAEKPAETKIPAGTGLVTGGATASTNNDMLIAAVAVIIIILVILYLMKKRKSNAIQTPAKVTPQQPQVPSPVQPKKIIVTTVNKLPGSETHETKTKYQYKKKK